MFAELPEIDRRLLNEFQRDLPLCGQPFLEIGATLGISETETLDRLAALWQDGLISRVGATIRPNTAGASTLAAMSVPQEDIDTVAAIVGREPGVNHSYLREHRWNLWFVVTAPDRDALDACLSRIRKQARLELLDLRLVRAFNIDLGFSLTDAKRKTGPGQAVNQAAILDSDRPILDALSRGLPLVSRPFAELGTMLGRSEADILQRISSLLAAGILTRLGVIVKHRKIGWNANAMVVWQVPEDAISEAGAALAAHPGITLCYQRNTVPGLWPFTLFSMIHARSRGEALGVLEGARNLGPLRSIPHEVLFSTRCFKQTGAMINATGERQVNHETHAVTRAHA
ncbi:MAG: AsnC family transcriptional regulator [Rhizobiaceae bacterium]